MKTASTKKLLFLFFLVFGLYIRSYSQNFDMTEVDTFGQATIKTIVPNAVTVRLRGLGGTWGLGNTNLPFTNMGNDLWQITTSPIATGFHYYRLEVNGILTSNPNEREYYGGNAWTSGLEIPGKESDFYSIKDVPHGTIRMQLYYSVTTGNIRRCFIYLPPSYDTRSIALYPVLFLQHGSGESEFSWHMQGKMNFILDNLIAEGKALPMIVVMDNGMTFSNNNNGYANLVINDLIPLVESKYQVLTGKQNRAVAGLSMGGGQALVAGLFNTDVFSYVGGFSGSISYTWNSIAQSINDSIELLWLGWGTSDEFASTWASDERQLKSGHVNHVKVLMSGGHQWQVWRNCLYQFAPLLFKPFTYPNTDIQKVVVGSDDFKVFPNPFSEFLNIKMNGDKLSELQFELYEITGKKLITFNGELIKAEKIVSEKLRYSPSNTYVLSISGKQSVYKVKIIKN